MSLSIAIMERAERICSFQNLAEGRIAKTSKLALTIFYYNCPVLCEGTPNGENLKVSCIPDLNTTVLVKMSWTATIFHYSSASVTLDW